MQAPPNTAHAGRYAPSKPRRDVWYAFAYKTISKCNGDIDTTIGVATPMYIPIYQKRERERERSELI